MGWLIGLIGGTAVVKGVELLFGKDIFNLLISASVSALLRILSVVDGVENNVISSSSLSLENLNYSLFNMIMKISKTAIIPIAVFALIIVIGYDIVINLMDLNNFKEFNKSILLSWLIKLLIGIFLITNSVNLTSSAFDFVNTASIKTTEELFSNEKIKTENKNRIIDNIAGKSEENKKAYFESKVEDFKKDLEAEYKTEEGGYQIGGLFLTTLLLVIISLLINFLPIIIEAILLGRMVEIYVMLTFAPIPFASAFSNSFHHSTINYFKEMMAYALQGVVMLIIMYVFRIGVLTSSADVGKLIMTISAYSLMTVVLLFQSKTLARTALGQ